MATINKKVLASALEHKCLGAKVPFLWHCYPTVNYCNAILAAIAKHSTSASVEKITLHSKVPKFTARILIQWLEKDAQLIKGQFDQGIKFYVLNK